MPSFQHFKLQNSFKILKEKHLNTVELDWQFDLILVPKQDNNPELTNYWFPRTLL